MTTFLLGLSVGGGCLTHCGPVLLPLLLCETARRWKLAATFLIARLCGYALVASATFFAGRVLNATAPWLHAGLFEAALYLLLGACLLRYGLNAKRETCEGHCSGKDNASAFGKFRKSGSAFAARTGFLTGLGLCAPMLAIVAEGAREKTYWGTLGTFLLFFLGTSAVLIPVFACGFACGGRTQAIRQIGFLAGFLAAGLYLLQGTYLLILEVINGCSL